MPNAEYWKKRFEQVEDSQHQIGVSAYADIEQQYRKAQKQIEGQIRAWYQRFADNNEITLEEARRMLTNKELAELKWDVKEYIKYGEENALNGQWVKQLENASARFHISRLEALKLQTQQSLEVMFGNQLDTMDDTMRSVYKSGFHKTAFEIQKGIGVGWDLGTLDDKSISKVINKPWAADGKNFSERVWGNRQKLVNELNQTLTQNIVLGADPQKAIDKIAKKMNTSKNNAGRLVMTEEAFFSSTAQKDCFKELDVEEYEIVATLDSHTSEICQEMDGKHFKMSEWVVGETAPPFHVRCRTTTAPYFDDDFGVPGKRAARTADDESIYYVPADMTYKQWQKTFVNGGKKSELKPVKTDDIIKATSKAVDIAKQSKPEKRKQLDTGYKGKIPDDDLPSYNQKALEQIKIDTGYSDKEAEKFQDALMNYFGGDYEGILNGVGDYAQIIKDGISRMPSYDGAIYRGLIFTNEDVKKFSSLKPGDEIPLKGIISSWTSDKDVGIAYMGAKSYERSSVILECVDNESGVGVQHISKFGSREAEVLSYGSYEVVDVTIETKYDWLSKHQDYLWFPEDLEEEANDLKKAVVCKIKVKEKN